MVEGEGGRKGMSGLARFSVSLEADLLEAFDRYVRGGAYATRSEAIRQLLHEALTRKSFVTDQAVVLASLTLVYEHHRPHLVEKMLALQHEHADQVVATLHVHIDHDRCLEVLVLRGRGQDLQRLAEALRGLKGVHRGELTLAETTIPTTSLGHIAPTADDETGSMAGRTHAHEADDMQSVRSAHAPACYGARDNQGVERRSRRKQTKRRRSRTP